MNWQIYSPLSRQLFLVPSLSFTSIHGFEIRTRESDPSISIHANPLLNRLYGARGITSADQLDTSLTNMISWAGMKGINTAVQLLLDARNNRQKILVVGDYDTDGATSTALAMLGLSGMGWDVQFLLPNRFEYGYGLSPEIVDLARAYGPDLILTVDNGIASFAGVERAQSYGMKVVITDHHLPADTLPLADAIVNPNQPGCQFVSKSACGCTVMYYLLIALRSALRDLGEQALPNLAQWLDLVALATIADVVPLDENNRRLVHHGLQRLRRGQCRPGIRALFEVAGRSWQQAKSLDFGFVIGPRLNAAGRLDDMTTGVDLLLSENEAEVYALAAQLNDLNVERRQIEASMLVDANLDLDKVQSDERKLSQVIYRDDWHEGVIGILASRVKDKLHRPVIAFAKGDNGLLKGSARSIPGVHLRDSLDWITKQQPELIEKFGGHAMAAGLTIQEYNLALFSQWFDKAIGVFSNDDSLVPHVWVDGCLADDDYTLEQAKCLENEGPWGQNFPEPCFVGEWPILEQKILAGKHLKFSIVQGEQVLSAIAFNIDAAQWPTPLSKVRGVFQLNCNRFRGEETLQLMFSKIEPTQ